MKQIDITQSQVKTPRRIRGRYPEWTPAELQTLERLYDEGVSHEDMAAMFGRCVVTIQGRLRKLGLSGGTSRGPRFVRPVGRSLALVASHYGMSLNELLRRSQERQLARRRWLAWWIARELGASEPKIAQLSRVMCHTSVRHGLKQARKLRANDEEFRDLSNLLLEFIRSGQDLLLPPPVSSVSVPPPEPPTPLPKPALVTEGKPSGFYDHYGREDRRSQVSYLEAQNERFCTAMRAALEEA